jgi:ABC-type Co2+ transport system permease subunit
MLRAFHAPLASGHLTGTRVLAGGLGCLLTALLNLLLKASQPAAFSTALLVTLGSYESLRAAISIIVAVLILTVICEPLRRWSMKVRERCL